MTTIIPLNKETVLLTNIWVQISCPNCGKSFNVQMKNLRFQKNCRCRKVTFHFALTTMKGSRVAVQVLAQKGFENPVEIFIDDYSIEED